MRATFSLRFLLLTFVAVACGLTTYSYSRGLHQTNHDFDVAIIGDGYFQVIEKGDESESMTYYTRSGRLSIDSEDQLCLRDHDRQWVIEPNISVPKDWTEFVVRKNGEVSVFVKGKRYSESIGCLQIARFDNEKALVAARGLYSSNDETGQATVSDPGENGLGITQQRWLDESHRASNPRSAAFAFALVMLIAIGIEFKGRNFRLRSRFVRSAHPTPPLGKAELTL